MKHTKGRFSIRKHPFIITFIIMAVIAVVVAVGYIDVNHRFPEPEEEIVQKDEWVQYSDGIKIKVTGIDYCTEQEVNEKYSASVKELGRFNYIVLKVKVQNESQDKFNMFSIVTDSNLVIYPDGYENQGMICEDNVSVNKGEVKDFTLAYVISKNYLSEKKLDKLLHEDIYLCFKAYPVRQAYRWMKKLKLLFNVSEAALTAAVFVLVTALVPMDIILKLVSQSVINGNPCLYDALISVNVSTMWRYVVPFVLFYVLYIQKYDLNSAIVIRRKNVRNVWINSQINMVVAAGFFSAYITVVTLVAGYLMTGKVYNWDEKFSKAFMATGDIVQNRPSLWLFIIAFVIEAFAILYVSGTLMMIMWWFTNNQWAGFLAALAVSSFENMAYMGFLTYYYKLRGNIYMNGVQIWRNILYPLILCLAVSLVTTVIIRRKDFFR